MDLTNKAIGKLGEKIASDFIKTRGYSILEKNYTTPLGEIDLISRDKDFLVFFEVKTRITEKFGTPLEGITEEKKIHIIRNCHFYLKKHRLLNTKCRIDSIGINIDAPGNLLLLKHIKNAVEIETTRIKRRF